MAKKIRFPLQMKDGAAVRTLDELREHFDLESVLGYYADGKLKTWLADRYYDEMAEKVAELSAATPDLKAKICEILGVDYSRQEDDTDFEALQRRNEKLRILREITTDSEILKKVDAVAFNQDELFDILDEAPEVIYLYGEKFSIPIAKGNITYIGVNNPEVFLEKDEFAYKENGISFSKVQIDDAHSCSSLSAAEKLILQGQYKKAFPIVQKLTENGDARAMYHMARFYIDGYNVVKINKGACYEWIKKTSSFSEPLSLVMYAQKFLDEERAEQKTILANCFERLKQMSASGDMIAQCQLGYMYNEGKGVEEDKAKAVECYRKAAEQGYARAQYNLGIMYVKGEGAEQDYTLAIKWYQKAADQGHAHAQNYLGTMYYYGKGVQQNYFIAAEWYRNAAEQGYAIAQCNLGWMYEYGEGVEQNDTLAAEWYRNAAEQGYAIAQCNLGWMYECGKGVEQNDTLAAEWYQKAAEQGYARAQKNLGVMYEHGKGVEQNYMLAVEGYRKAAEQGYASAQSNLGDCFYYGRGVYNSYSDAFEWYQKAAEQGYAYAQYSLGWCYANGEGVETDVYKAFEWFQKAANQGNESAKDCLDKLKRELPWCFG